MNDLLLIKNLQVDFISEDTSFTAVNNVTIEVKSGEIVAIVGESGSGKSVTALSTLRLIPAPPARYTKGEILFTDKQGNQSDLLKVSSQHLQAIRGNVISMIFQEPMSSLNPVHTCGEQVREAIILHQKISAEEAKKKTLSLFESVHLPNPSLHESNAFV